MPYAQQKLYYFPFISWHDHHPPYHIIHKCMLSIVKMLAEGQQSEIKIMLGWQINTREFIVQLPRNKFLRYTKQLREVIRLKKSSNDNFRSIIGRLEQVTYAVPHSRYFLNHLRHLQMRTEKRHNVHIPKSILSDLHLFVTFINQAHIGTNINNLICRRPSHLYWSDSYPFGLGGYSARGRAWHLYTSLP